jgi:hypothetical protein
MLNYSYDPTAIRWNCIFNSTNSKGVMNFLNSVQNNSLMLLETTARNSSNLKGEVPDGWFPEGSVIHSLVKITNINVGLNTPVPNCILTYCNQETQKTYQIQAHTIDLNLDEIIVWSGNTVYIFIQ